MVESGPVKKSRKQLLQRPRDLALLTGLLVSALTVLLSFHSTCLLTEQKSLTSAELLSSLLNTTTTNTTAVVSTTATQNQRKTNSNETDKKKNLVIVNAVGQRSNLPLNVHAMDNHFSQDDWDCILFMYMNETVIPDDDDNLWKLQQEERCAVIRTPGIPWGVFLQFLPPLLVNQYEYIAVLLDDIYLPRQGKRPINVPRLLSQMQTHNLSSITPGIVSDNHRVLNPNKHKDYQDCLVEVKFIETFFQIFTLPAWKCFYNLLHYKGGRGWYYDICFAHICGGRLAVDYGQAAYHVGKFAITRIPKASVVGTGLESILQKHVTLERIDQFAFYNRTSRENAKFVAQKLQCPIHWIDNEPWKHGLKDPIKCPVR